ncbi:hypothetical protein CN442_08715 [Bacillus thuringiensis]|nr:hypothetical protein CN442_08715 [Bacillus thuringiensis]
MIKVRIFEKDDVQLHLLEITISARGKNIGYRLASASIFIDLKSLSIKLFNINIYSSSSRSAFLLLL